MMNDARLYAKVNKIRNKALGGTWCSEELAYTFINLIIENKPSLCVEIGVFGGGQVAIMATALKYNGHGLVHGIDPWTNQDALEEMIDKANVEWWSKVDMEDVYESCQNIMSYYALSDHVKLKRKRSDEAVDDYENESIDLLSIDGNHGQEHALYDATAWLPKVKRGGVIFFDDIDWHEGGKCSTEKAVCYLQKYCKEINLVDNTMILRKL